MTLHSLLIFNILTWKVNKFILKKLLPILEFSEVCRRLNSLNQFFYMKNFVYQLNIQILFYVNKRMNSSLIISYFNFRNSLEEQQIVVKEILSLYQAIEELLENKMYSTVLPPELHKCYPNYLKQIANRMNDIRKLDHGIVIAGVIF